MSDLLTTINSAAANLSITTPITKYLVYSLPVVKYMEQAGIATRDSNGTYWAFGLEIKLIEQL